MASICSFGADHLSPHIAPLFRRSGLPIMGVQSGHSEGGMNMLHLLRKLCRDDEGQDIAEYAVMLAVILVLVVGTIRLIGSNANNVFSSAASSIQ